VSSLSGTCLVGLRRSLASNRYEMAVHENAHHVYHANTGRHSRHHPEDWETIEDNISFNASRFCRGGG
ncbi:MAG: hypothetical protein OXH09_20590, partial [Gammaproteobacteria bacterium]|nr:hypothetical protein [Gammaproteobacteria bacterium]